MLCKLLFSSLLTLHASVISHKFYESRHNASDYMQERVVSGVAVPVSMYPHVASITYYQRPFCGSSIITDRITITAAHCLLQHNSTKKKLVYSMAILVGSSIKGQGKEYEVHKIRVHPKYKRGLPRHDIGLIMVKRPFVYGPNVQKIPLVTNERWKKEKYTFTVAGFGAISTEGMVHASHLLSTRLRYVDFNVCKRVKTNINHPIIIHKGVFCLMGTEWNGDCFGDSGSGIIWKTHLVGLVSAGLVSYCGSVAIPSIYTDIFYYLKWIKMEVKRLLSSKKYSK